MANTRYIVTFKDEEIDTGYAARSLSVSNNRVKDAIGVLTGSEALDDKDALVFEEIGAAALTLSASQADKLAKDKGVAEVVPDFEVFALSEDDPWHVSSDISVSGADGQSAFEAGYWQAIQDLYGWSTPGHTDRDADSFSMPLPPGPPWGGPWPPRPFPPRPFPPVPFPPRPRPPWLPLPPRPWPILRPPITPGQPVPWNIEMVKADEVWGRVTGRGAKVAIIDTGIDEDHPDLTVSGGVSFVPGVTSWDDDHSHGTHCAGIAGARNNMTGIVGVAPGCDLYAVKVMRPLPTGGASGDLSWILAGMGWARREGMDVASMSLGSNVDHPDAPCVLAYQRAAQRLIDAGCIVIAAAGNSGRSSRPWVGNPARCAGFMAVASVDRNGVRSPTSSNGPDSLQPEEGIEISAPGVSVRSTMPGGGYAAKSGTSMACPHVAGAAALIKERHPTWSPARIRRHLRATASDLGAPGSDSEYGFGLLDCRKAIL